jgi:hypothetical protein
MHDFMVVPELLVVVRELLHIGRKFVHGADEADECCLQQLHFLADACILLQSQRLVLTYQGGVKKHTTSALSSAMSLRAHIRGAC